LESTHSMSLSLIWKGTSSLNTGMKDTSFGNHLLRASYFLLMIFLFFPRTALTL